MLYAVCFAIFAIGVAVAFPSEQHGSAVLRQSGVNITHSASQVGGNMTDKEVRFGIANTALWATATTDVSNGSVNGGHDAFTPAGGAVPLINMFLGEVEPGGVGSGIYGLIFYVLIAVFVAGLMVGRTPEWLGQEDRGAEMKLAAVGALAVPTMALVMAAVAIVTQPGSRRSSIRARTASPRRSTPTRRSRTTTGAPSPATAATDFSTTLGRIALYFGRFFPLLAGARDRQARSPRRRSSPPRPGRSAPTAGRSGSCSSASSRSRPG